MLRPETSESSGGVRDLRDPPGLRDPVRVPVVCAGQRRGRGGPAGSMDHRLDGGGFHLPEGGVDAERLRQRLRVGFQPIQRHGRFREDFTDRMRVGRDEVEPAAGPPQVFARIPDRPHEFLDLADHLAAPHKRLPAPLGRILDREGGAVDGQAVLLEPGEPPDQLVGRHFTPSDRLVDLPGVVVEAGAGFAQQHSVFGASLRLRPAHRQRAPQFVEHRALVGLVAVELQTRVAEVDGVQTTLDDLQGGHLLGHEEHLSVTGQRLADQVGDRLRLPGPRRALDHQVATVDDVQDRERLGAVGIHHRMETRHPLVVVDGLLVADIGRCRGESIASEELPDQRMVGRLVLLGPGLRVKILVDEQLAEGEEVEVDLVALDRPALLPRDRLLHPGQVLVHIEVVLGRHLRETDGEVLFQLRLEREVGFDVVLRPGKLEVLPDAGAGQLHGDQDEGGTALRLAGVRFVPPEAPEREVEDVDPLLFDREAGLTESLAEAEVEGGRGKRGLDLVVGVASGRLAGFPGGFGEEGEEFGGDVVKGVGRLAGVRGRWLSFRGGPEVHDASVSHQDGEELAGQFVDDLDATPFGGAEVEKGVAEREVEHVAAGLLDFGLDGGDGGHLQGRGLGWDVGVRYVLLVPQPLRYALPLPRPQYACPVPCAFLEAVSVDGM